MRHVQGAIWNKTFNDSQLEYTMENKLSFQFAYSNCNGVGSEVRMLMTIVNRTQLVMQ